MIDKSDQLPLHIFLCDKEFKVTMFYDRKCLFCWLIFKEIFVVMMNFDKNILLIGQMKKILSTKNRL